MKPHHTALFALAVVLATAALGCRDRPPTQPAPAPPPPDLAATPPPARSAPAPVIVCASPGPACPTPFRCTPAGTCETDTEVLVPAGPFIMGCDRRADPDCQADEAPSRSLTLDAFAIDRTEVTVAAYARCVDAGACTAPRCAFDPDHPLRHRCSWGRPDAAHHPANGVDWAQASAFCRFAGRRLPTEAEWEKAARGPDGRIRPWGDEAPMPGGPLRANIADESAGQRYGWRVVEGHDDGFPATAPVGRFPASAGPYGTLDQVGNVWEWTADMYPLPAGAASAPDAQRARIIKGGGYANFSHCLRAAFRGSVLPTSARPAFGFRCARSLVTAVPRVVPPAPD